LLNGKKTRETLEESGRQTKRKKAHHALAARNAQQVRWQRGNDPKCHFNAGARRRVRGAGYKKEPTTKSDTGGAAKKAWTSQRTILLTEVETDREKARRSAYVPTSHCKSEPSDFESVELMGTEAGGWLCRADWD